MKDGVLFLLVPGREYKSWDIFFTMTISLSEMNFLRRHSLLLFVFTLGLFPQVKSSAQVMVDSTQTGKSISGIMIFGNEKTKAHIILREMKSKAHTPLDLSLIAEDQMRIQNLGLFNRVMVTTEPVDDTVLIIVQVAEKIFFIPYPIFFINDRDWSKLSYGAGAMHFNFRGRAEILTGSLWFGYDPSIQLSYVNPWIGGRHHLRLSTQLYYQRIQSKDPESDHVKEDHWGTNLTLGKRIGYHTHVNATIGYREVILNPPVPGHTLALRGKDELPKFGVSLTWDHRDLWEYPKRGWYVGVAVSKTGFFSTKADYARALLDARVYIPLTSKITYAIRASTVLSDGEIPLYDRLYLGYSERVRGHFFEIFQGENRCILSMALRFPILPIRYIHLAELPELRDLKFGISVGLFADAGVVWFPSQSVTWQRFKKGYGAGIHLHLPYINVLRFEIAFDENQNTQYIIDMGVDI